MNGNQHPFTKGNEPSVISLLKTNGLAGSQKVNKNEGSIGFET